MRRSAYASELNFGAHVGTFISLYPNRSLNDCNFPEQYLIMKHDEEAETLGNESAYEDATEMKRRIRRGDESKGDADERDVAGDYSNEHPETTDTAQDQGLRGRRVPS